MRWLVVLVAANGMPNIRIWSASSSYFGQTPATSSTAKLVLWLHGDCYQRLKTPSSGPTSISKPHACARRMSLLFVICWDGSRRRSVVDNLYPFIYILTMPSPEKPLEWIGSSYKDLLALPDDVRRHFGFALSLAQAGDKHDDAKVLKGFGGAGVLEVVEDDAGGTYRAVYTVKFAEAVFVLHCFQKKSKRGIATPKEDMDIVNARLKIAEAYVKELRK